MGLAVSAVAAACSLSGLSDGVALGGRDSSDGDSAENGPAEGAPGEGGAPREGGTPADSGPTDSGPHAPIPLCAPGAHTFCDDFDHPDADAFALWDSHGDGISISNDASVSSPNSASIKCIDGNGDGRCWLQKTFPPVSGLKFQLRVRLVQMAGAGHGIWELTIGGGQEYAVELYRANGGADLEICNHATSDCTTIPRMALPSPDSDGFQKISGEVHFADGGRIEMSINDQPVRGDAGPLLFDGTKGVVFGVGDIYSQPGDSEILVDDVAVDTFEIGSAARPAPSAPPQ